MVGIWLVGCLSGSVALWSYASRAGARGDSPGRWPAASPLARVVGRPTLLLFTHPRCPCTVASLAELARLVTDLGDRIDVGIIVDAPNDDGSAPAVERARAIPRARLIFDPTHAERERFGISTSGHVLLYDGTGRLQFSGGITDGRGHEGSSVGVRRVERLVSGAIAAASSPVFGCLLAAEARAGAAP